MYFSAKFLICQYFDILGIFSVITYRLFDIICQLSYIWGILLLPLPRRINVVFSGQLLAAV